MPKRQRHHNMPESADADPVLSTRSIARGPAVIGVFARYESNTCVERHATTGLPFDVHLVLDDVKHFHLQLMHYGPRGSQKWAVCFVKYEAKSAGSGLPSVCRGAALTEVSSRDEGERVFAGLLERKMGLDWASMARDRKAFNEAHNWKWV